MISEGALFLWASPSSATPSSAPPPLLASGIELPDSQSVDVDHLRRLCILESENSLPHMAAPTVLYLTPSGEIHGWHALGQADCYKAKGQVPGLVQGEVCLTLTCASACVGVCLTSTGRVISISFDYNASDASPFSCCEIASPQAENQEREGATSSSGGIFAWFGGSGYSSSMDNSTNSTTTSRHPGTVAVRNAPNGQDKALECCVDVALAPNAQANCSLTILYLIPLWCSHQQSTSVSKLRVQLDY